MEKPIEILKLEKELNCSFKLVKLEEISEWKFEKTSEYSIDENGNINGIVIRKFELKEIPQGLTKIKTLLALNLKNNQIIDISSLQNLTNLTVLNLNNNQIIDISSLQNLTNLIFLDLRLNQIINISYLKYLTKKKNLDSH